MIHNFFKTFKVYLQLPYKMEKKMSIIQNNIKGRDRFF